MGGSPGLERGENGRAGTLIFETLVWISLETIPISEGDLLYHGGERRLGGLLTQTRQQQSKSVSVAGGG